MAFVTSSRSFLLLVVRPRATSSVLAPSSDALCYYPAFVTDQRFCGQLCRGFFLLWLWPLLREGAKRPLKEEDIYECPAHQMVLRVEYPQRRALASSLVKNCQGRGSLHVFAVSMGLVEASRAARLRVRSAEPQSPPSISLRHSLLLRIPRPLRAEALDPCWHRNIGAKTGHTSILWLLLRTFGWRCLTCLGIALDPDETSHP